MMAAQWVTDSLARPPVVLMVTATEQTPDGRQIRWTLSVTREGMMDIDGKPVKELRDVGARIIAARSGGKLRLDATVSIPLKIEELTMALEKLAAERDKQAAKGTTPLGDKVPGLIGGLEQLRRQGVAIGKLPAHELGEHLGKLFPLDREAALAQRVVGKTESQIALLRHLRTEAQQLATKMTALRKGLERGEAAGMAVGLLSTDELEERRSEIQEELTLLETEGVPTALGQLVEKGKFSAEKVEGLTGHILSLQQNGIVIGKLPAGQLKAKLDDLRLTDGELAAVRKTLGLLERDWVFEALADGTMTLDRLPATVVDVTARVAQYAAAGNKEEYAKAVTVADVLEAVKRGEIKAPSRPYNAFPGRMTYEQAWPKGEVGILPPRADKPENTITSYSDAPALHDRALQEKLAIRQYVDGENPGASDWDSLPPVEDRLPLYPAVMVGPDAKPEEGFYGNYGGRWYRCASSDWDVTRKVGYPSFVRFDPKGDLQPHFAYKWKVENENRVFTFWLRPGHKWSDGHPWTAHDIAWVCNVNIGSDHWPSAANWMMETDGSIQLYPDDVKDWAALARRILSEAAADKPTPGKRLMAIADGELPAFIKQLASAGVIAQGKMAGLKTDLLARGDEAATLATLTAKDFKEAMASHKLSDEECKALRKRLGGLKLVRLRSYLEAIRAGNLPDMLQQAKIASVMNKLFESTSFYNRKTWAAVDLTSELAALETRGVSTLDKMALQRYEFLALRKDLLRRIALSEVYAESLKKDKAGRLTAEEEKQLATLRESDKWLRQGVGDIDLDKQAALLKKFNLLVFRAAYPDLVAKAVRERVKVEALDDHTIRFTFKKPNSIFLEKTATFMYYRGLFTINRHFFGTMHPDGTCELMVDDVLKWDKFLEALTIAGRSAAASPARQVWSLMNEDTRDLVLDRLPGDDEAAMRVKKAIIAELNRIMRRREFYNAEAWASVNLTSELATLRDKGYSTLNAKPNRRYMQLIMREDMLRRGVADLKATDADDKRNELLVFNADVFRAAFSAEDPTLEGDKREEASMVAFSRENALDIVAKADEFMFDGWVYKLRLLAKLRTRYHVPTLAAWRIVSDSMDVNSVAIRNPYFFAVDPAGRQLPYLDTFVTEKQGRPSVRMLKLTSGNVSFQCRDIDIQHFTVLKQNERGGDYQVYRWANDYCGELNFYFPQARKTERMLELQSHPEFRKAMSYALNRQEIIDVVYKGMGKPAQWSVPKGSKYYNEKQALTAVDYRPDLANKILDELGCDKRAGDGTRLWQGEPLILNVVTTEDRPPEAIQMACNYWQAIGINCQMKVQRGTLIGSWLSMGTLDIGTQKEGGNYFGPILAGNIAPTHPAECGWGTKWVEWLRSSGRSGWEPPDRIKELDVMWSTVLQAPNEAEKLKAWRKLTDRAAEQLPVIGVMTSPGRIVYVKNGFKNVPKLSLAGWMAHEPGNNCPEVFFWDKEQD
jgi:ABC-type transport system substrate-binding protein